jgi:hypothetical protein
MIGKRRLGKRKRRRATCGGEEMSMGSTGLGEKDVREEGLPYDQ